MKKRLGGEKRGQTSIAKVKKKIRPVPLFRGRSKKKVGSLVNREPQKTGRMSNDRRKKMVKTTIAKRTRVRGGAKGPDQETQHGKAKKRKNWIVVRPWAKNWKVGHLEGGRRKKKFKVWGVHKEGSVYTCWRKEKGTGGR